MRTNYFKKLVKDLDKLLAEIQPLKRLRVALTEQEDQQALANAKIINDLKKARKLLHKDFDAAAALIANIPYFLKSPHGDITKQDKYVGSMKVYRVTDTLRHYVRMIDLSREGQVGKGKIWNNVLVLLG